MLSCSQLGPGICMHGMITIDSVSGRGFEVSRFHPVFMLPIRAQCVSSRSCYFYFTLLLAKTTATDRLLATRIEWSLLTQWEEEVLRFQPLCMFLIQLLGYACMLLSLLTQWVEEVSRFQPLFMFPDWGICMPVLRLSNCAIIAWWQRV
jgi:hypothetical protein